MTITIEASDIHDARQKLGFGERPCSIRIRWRRGADYGRVTLQGCIVDATDTPTELVPVAFESNRKAISYISKLLRAHDAYVKQEQKRTATEAKAAKKK